MNDQRYGAGPTGHVPSAPPGWYSDPTTGRQRWWDGQAWGPHAPAGPAQPSTGYFAASVAPDERSWAMWSHLGPLLVAVGAMLLTAGALSVLAFVFPLVVMNTVGSRSGAVRAHAVESLNFQLSMLVYSLSLLVVLGIVTVVTFGLGLVVMIPVLLGLGVFEVVVMVIASVRASNGGFYRYPLNIRFVR